MPARSHRGLWAVALSAIAPHVFAGAFGVSPIRVDLDPGSRTGLVTVSSEDDRKLYFQVKLFEWTQTPSGDDVLAESNDLIFFPQILTVEPKERRIIRVGVKAPPAGGERAFRLFIEELPDPGEATPGGAQIAVRLRFGVPIFVAGTKGEPLPEIGSIEMSKGYIRVPIRNNGTRHIRFEEISARAGEKLVTKTAGWYVFPGATRTFALPVNALDCPVPKSLEVHAVAEGKDVRANLEATPALCSP